MNSRQAAPVFETLRPGDEVAGYRVVELMRRGNDFDVYDVWSEERACRCVAKVPRPDRAAERSVVRRLRREGQLLLDLAHPHIVRAYELVSGPPPVLVTEALPGATLDALLEERKRLPTRDLAQLGVHLCSACHYLHGTGYLHLDVKPSNVVVQAGLARLIDLGIARPSGRARRVAGTDLYMAPEQARAHALSSAADVWGVGLVLYEAAAGFNPVAALMERLEPGSADDPPQARHPLPSVRDTTTRLPRRLRNVIDACLKLDPGARPGVHELRHALEMYLAETDCRARTS